MSLLDKMLKAGGKDIGADVMSKSAFFNDVVFVKSDLPILNVAYSGKLDGGMTPGLTIICGESKTFKSALSLYCLKSYLDTYEDAIGILYDSEFGITTDYIKSFGIDPSRIIHIPVEHIEQLKFDMIKKLEAINKGDRVFFLVDSIGQISSKKETEDAHDEKSVADMTRAKALRSLLRLVTLQFTKKSIPCIMINHVYQSIGGLYPTTVIPGGTSVTYSSNSIFVITKAQEKSSDGELNGWNFTINIHKSRYVKEKSKMTFQVLYDSGINKYSGLLDLGIESGVVVKPSNGWYSRVDEDGVIEDKKYRLKDTLTKEFWGKLLERQEFKQFVENKYMLANSPIITDEQIEEEFE